MAYNDTKSTGDSLTAAEWNAMVIALENITSGHDHDGVDSKAVVGANVTNVAAGGIVATDVQAAVNELDTEKAPKASPTFTGTIRKSVTATITAFATGGQASAVELDSDINEVAVCATGGDSVKLLEAVVGMEIVVINHGIAAMDLFPASGDFINEAAVNVATSIAVDATAVCYCYSADNWEVTEVTR